MTGVVRLQLINEVSVILILPITAFRIVTMNGEVLQRLMNARNVLVVLQTLMPVFRTVTATGEVLQWQIIATPVPEGIPG
jgi:hypothetical protein